MSENKPRIACFVCNFAFCEDKTAVPENTTISRVNCVGRMDPALILKVLEKGVDGVLIAGCKPPDCHYVDGNLQAERAVKMLQKLVALTGLESERIKLLWYSPLEERSFSYFVKEFSGEIEKLAPSPLKDAKPESTLVINVLAATNAASDFRLRVLLGREKELTEGVNVYSEKLSQQEFDELSDEIVEDEFIRQKIYVLTKTKPLSVKDLAEAIEMQPAAVLKQIVNMRRRNMIALDSVKGTTPLYRALEVK